MIKLSDDLKHRFVNALTDGVAMVLAMSIATAIAHVSPYGSLYASGDDQLALWVQSARRSDRRNRAERERAIFYAQLSSRTFVRMRGRARVAGTADERTRVFEGMHSFEQRGDPERKGVAILIDLDSAAGREADGTMFNMTR
jgi:hypothetical protein